MGGRGDWPAAAAAWLSNNFTAISATGWVARMARRASHKLCSHGCLRWGLESASKDGIKAALVECISLISLTCIQGAEAV